jgi:hypothetical protein
MTIRSTKRFITAYEFAHLLKINTQRAYEILRRNPSIVVRLGKRQIRIDSMKLEDWIARGGSKEESTVRPDEK